MKTNAVFILFVLVLIGTSTEAMADTLPVKPKTPELAKPKLQKIYGCPTGWHISEGSFKPDQFTICLPNTPNMHCPPAPNKIHCPPGTYSFVEPCRMVGCAPFPE
jgi:hypothetical protein